MIDKGIESALCDISAEYLRSRLTYCPDTGAFTWLERIDANRPKWCNTRFAGKPAGYKDPTGRHIINIDYTLYAAHRLAWLYMTGEWPTQIVDHADNDPGNNKWSNLREATRSQNNANKKVNFDSASGLKGVRHRGNGRYEARITTGERGKPKSLGMFSTAEDAAKAYLTEAKKRFGEFARSA